MKTTLSKTLKISTALSTAMLIAAPAFAQAAPSDESSNARDGDIVVTAQKIEQKSVDVPITISAVTGERISQLGVSDLDELSAYVPGLNIQEQSANNPGVVIRGITSDSGSSQQGPRVTLYYNGVDISRSRGSYQAIYDLERVEVIKGPQATLFGTASAVGAISLNSAKPQPGISAELTGGLGNYGQTLLAGHLNSGTEKFAVRFAFESRIRDGYVENLSVSQEKELYAQDQFGARLSVRARPTDGLTIDLIGTFDRQRNGGTPFISGTFATSAGPANPFGSANLGGSPVSGSVLGIDELALNRDVYDLNLTVSAELSDTITFTTVNGYREFNSLETFDADGTAAWYLEFAERAEGWQASHEGRFALNTPNLRGSGRLERVYRRRRSGRAVFFRRRHIPTMCGKHHPRPLAASTARAWSLRRRRLHWPPAACSRRFRIAASSSMAGSTPVTLCLSMRRGFPPTRSKSPLAGGMCGRTVRAPSSPACPGPR